LAASQKVNLDNIVKADSNNNGYDIQNDIKVNPKSGDSPHQDPDGTILSQDQITNK
jgi:hypothetical protein